MSGEGWSYMRVDMVVATIQAFKGLAFLRKASNISKRHPMYFYFHTACTVINQDFAFMAMNVVVDRTGAQIHLMDNVDSL